MINVGTSTGAAQWRSIGALDLDSTAVARLKSFSLAAGIAICIIGLAAFVARSAHVAWLARIFSHQTSADWVCPVAFSASGVALVVWSRFPRAALVARVLGAIIASIGAWFLIEGALLAALGASARTGGIPPTSSVSLMLIGATNLLLPGITHQRRATLAQGMALAAGILALITLTGLLYDEGQLRALFGAGRVDMVRPLALVSLSLGLLCLRPDVGFMRVITTSSASARLLRRLLPAIVAVPLLLGWLAMQGYRLGLYSQGLNVALFALSNVIIFGFLLFGQVRTVLAAEQREKNIEAALRDMQRRERARAAELEALMDAVPAVVLVAHDADARRITGNRAAAEMLRMPKDTNMSKAALSGTMHYRLFKDGKELSVDEMPVQIAARGATVRNFEHEVVFKDGERHALYGNATPLFDAQGAPRGALAAFIDVTDRRQTEEALRESEERLRRAQAVGRIGTWDYDVVANRLHGSDELYRLFGLAPDAMPVDMTTLYAHMPPDDVTKIRVAVRRAITKKQPFTVEFRLCRPSGLERIVLGQGEVIAWTPAGQAGRMVGTMIDITERKQAEDLLAAEKERLAVTLNSIADGVIATDRHGHIVSINDVAKVLLGVKSGDLTGRSVRDEFCLLESGERVREGDIVTEAIAHRRGVDIPGGVTLRTASGGRRPIAGKAAPIYRRAEVIGAVLVFRDISEQQKQEEEFLRAQKLESVGLLAGGIAHDFNNILTAIFGNIHLARLGLQPGAPAAEPLAEAEKAFGRARDLTQQLLTFAKGGAPIRKTAAIAELLIETTRFAMRGTNHRVELDIAQDLLPVKFDAGQMSQVINNIVINAKQAMPAGGRFRVEAQNAVLDNRNPLGLPGGRYVQLRFKDWGGGIAPEHLEHVFDPYFTTKPTGTGLGLATAYSIVRRHEGHITVNSKVGKGSTFTVHLPVSDESVDSPMLPVQTVKARQGRILLMDDDAAIRNVGRALLEKLGYQAETAKDGVEALRLYGQAIKQGRSFAVVILDLTVIGGMGGVDCLLHLKRLDPPVRALVSSGYSNDPVMAAYADYGFAGVVAKPYQLAELSKTLAALFALGERANPPCAGGESRVREEPPANEK